MSQGGDGVFVIDARATPWRPAQTAAALFTYLVLFHISFRVAGLFEVQSGVSSWYPAAGLRFAFLLLFGWRFGFVALAAEFVQAPVHELLGFWVWRKDGPASVERVVALLIAVATPPACYSVAVYALERRGLLTMRIEPVARVFWFCGAAAAGAALTAVVGCANLAISGALPWTALRQAALAWWSGDLVGILTVAPALVITGQWWLARGPKPITRARLIPVRTGLSPEVVVAEGMVMVAVAAILFGSADALASPLRWYPIILPVSWLALRFGLTGAVFGIFASSIGVATLAAVWGARDVLLNVDVLLVVLSVSGLLMGCVVSTLQTERAGLDHRVRERTQDLNAEVVRRRSAELAAIEAKRRAERYLSIARTIMVALDTEWRVQMINDEGCNLLGLPRETLLGRDWLQLAVPPDEHGKIGHVLSKLISGDETPHDPFESAVFTGDGDRRIIDWRMTAVRDGGDSVIGTLSSGIDITERLAAEQRVRYLANHDAVTGLRNRNSLLDHFAGAVARARRSETALAVLFIDLDGFKRVNDDFGHAAGDHVLAEVARRLTPCVRESDTVTRFGGDEFVVLLEGLTDRDAGAMMAEKILDVLSRPIRIGDAVLPVGASIGIAYCPDHGEDPEDLIRLADAAMYTAKRSAGLGYAVAPSSSPAIASPVTNNA